MSSMSTLIIIRNSFCDFRVRPIIQVVHNDEDSDKEKLKLHLGYSQPNSGRLTCHLFPDG